VPCKPHALAANIASARNEGVLATEKIAHPVNPLKPPDLDEIRVIQRSPAPGTTKVVRIAAIAAPQFTQKTFHRLRLSFHLVASQVPGPE
jgi:hypothetical protein